MEVEIKKNRKNSNKEDTMAKSTALALPNISRTRFGKIVKRNERTLKTLAGAGLITLGGIGLFRLINKTTRDNIRLGGGSMFLYTIGNLVALTFGTILVATDGK